jgi:uncharacterized protein (TIGR03067 family)
MSTYWLWVVAFALGLGADAANDEPVKKELNQLKGSWTMTALQYNGKDFGTEGKLRFRFVFQGEQVTVEGDDKVKQEYAKLTLKLDPETKPRCMDLTIAAGIQKDSVIEAIYELNNDELKICGRVAGKERPAEFAAPAGSSLFLLVLRREKP